MQTYWSAFKALILLYITYIYKLAEAGTLKGTGSNPIDPSITNRNQYSDYVFTFIPDTKIPKGGLITVVFPYQFEEGLGFTTGLTCSLACTLNSYTVTLTANKVFSANTEMSITIYGVLNPSTKGGTGSFKLATYDGVNKLDENLIFGVIGISDSAGKLTSNIVSFNPTASTKAGDLSSYQFQFKTSTLFPAGSYMRFYFPKGFSGLTAYPTCKAFSVNGYIAQGKLYCVSKGDIVVVTGFSADIPKNAYVGIEIAAYNPPFVGITDSFSIFLLRSGTNAVYDLAIGISGLSITAGTVSDISFNAVDPLLIKSLLKVQDYRVSFRLTNPLVTGNVITIEFPPSITVATFTGFTQNYIVSGLDDISEDSTVSLSMGANNMVQITNFKSFTKPELITLQLRLTNPNNEGLSTALKIRTYTDILMKTLIDEDTVTATITIEKIQSGGSNHKFTTATYSSNIIIPLLEFQLYPSVALPVGNRIVIKIPIEFDIGVINITTCMVKPFGGGYVSPTSCFQNGQYIYIDPDVAFTANVQNNIRLTNVLTTPDRNGSFLFDTTTYADGVTVSESWSDMLVVTGSGFLSASVTSLCVAQIKWTIYTFTFMTNFTIPAGITQSKATDTKGYFEMNFNYPASYIGWGTLAPFSRVPCRPLTGLVALTDEVYCTVDNRGTANFIVTIDNFQTIPGGTSIKIEFPKVQNYWGAYTVNIRAISKQNRIQTLLSVITISTPLSGIAGLSDNGASVSNHQFSMNEVSRNTNLTFTPGNTIDITGAGTIVIQLPSYDTGWVETTNSVSCQIGSVVYQCTSYKMADWILIPLTFIQTLTIGQSITLYGLKVPRYANIVGSLIFRFIKSTTLQEFSYRTQAAFPMPGTPKFLTSALNVDKKGIGAIAVTYTFIFSSVNEIPQGAQIKVTFPSNYDLLSTDPEIKVSSDLEPISDTVPITYSTSLYSITVDGFKAVKAGSTFRVIASGVKNPTGATISQYYIAEVLLNTYQMVYHYNFDRFSFTPAATIGYITFNSITSIPLNANEDAKYIIQIVPATAIPAGGVIVITFPSKQYKQLPTPPICSISGAAKTFTYCRLTGNVYTIQLNTNYVTGSINIMIDGITNPDKGTTNGFDCYTMYDGVIIDVTDGSNLDGRTLTTTSSVSPITMSGDGIVFTPQNEGEIADYYFSFVTSNALDPGMQIYIKFPDDYDALLGPSIACDRVSGLLGTISCTVSNRAVYISGFDTYLPDTTNPIQVVVYGVVNPNYLSGTSTGYFKIGTMEAASTSFLDYNSEAGKVNPVAAPGWATLYEIYPTNLYTRLEADYSFNFTPTASIPRTNSKGYIKVSFPNQFSIDDGTVACDTVTTKFAPVISCVSFRNFVFINGHTQDYSGNIKCTLRQIVNPTEPGITDQLVIMTFDTVNKRVIERSYRNLDFFSFNYTYPGPLIHINNDETVTLYAGTQTPDLYITVDYPCALNLTLKPLVPGFSTIPYNMPLTLGMVSTTFRISVPENFPPGTYYIEWQTYNDLVPPYYTPVKKTPVIVKANPGLKIQVPTPFPVPYGGSSLVNYFTVPHSPDTGFDISINFLTSYSGITLDVTSINWKAGVTTVGFQIFSSNDTSVTGGTVVTGGTLVLSVTGVNAAIFSLSASSIDFQVVTALSNPVALTSSSVSDITKTSATLNLVVSDIAMIYYMIALDSTEAPSFREVARRGPPPYPSTVSRYGSILIGYSKNAKVYFSDLVAQTPYIVYIYLVDRGLHFVGPSRVSFVTSDRLNAAEFTIQFLTGYMSAEDINKAIKGVAFTLSLPERK